MDKVRQANLQLLRHSVFNTTQESFAKTLNIAQSKLSRLEQGKDALDNSSARSIEKSYKLPAGWMDRDNSEFFLSSEEFGLVKDIRELSIEQQKSVLNIIAGVIKLVSTKPQG